jgi:glucosamine-6-phosphate deaminase
MKILILSDPAAAVRRATAVLIRQIRAKPQSVLGLATGGSMEPVYAALVAEVQAGRLDLGQIRSFNLDEYVGLGPDHPQSYHHFMQSRLFGPVGLGPGQSALPRGDAADPEAEAERYDQAIEAAGGIDLQLLGLGVNGHIGFNEPSSSLASRTRIKTLTRQTITDNARFFAPGEIVPRHAITMGIGTIMEARAVLLLATGTAKAEALAAMVEGPVSARVPASVLQFHRHVTVICDEAAAAALALRDYYDCVHPAGAEPDLG